MKSKIYHNIKESTFSYYDDKTGLKLFFSSVLYLNKFINKKEDYIIDESVKLKYKYNIECTFDFRMLFLISLYKKIEKRGKYILLNGNEFTINDMIYLKTNKS